MTPAEKAYNDYKDSVDNKYAGGLIPEITNYVDELRVTNKRLRISLNNLKDFINEIIHFSNERVKELMLGYGEERTVSILKTMEELGEELCNYCPLPEDRRGCRSALVNCEGRFCEEAYNRYQEEYETEKE